MQCHHPRVDGLSKIKEQRETIETWKKGIHLRNEYYNNFLSTVCPPTLFHQMKIEVKNFISDKSNKIVVYIVLTYEFSLVAILRVPKFNGKSFLIELVSQFSIRSLVSRTGARTLSKYNSVAHVEIIVIWHLSSLVRLSSFRNRKVLKASCK